MFDQVRRESEAHEGGPAATARPERQHGGGGGAMTALVVLGAGAAGAAVGVAVKGNGSVPAAPTATPTPVPTIPDISGNWSWFFNGNQTSNTYKLTQAGGTFTGTVNVAEGDVPVTGTISAAGEFNLVQHSAAFCDLSGKLGNNIISGIAHCNCCPDSGQALFELRR
jgi:hypothetical protein